VICLCIKIKEYMPEICQGDICKMPKKSGKDLAVGKAQRRIQKSGRTALEKTNTLVVSETLHACKERSGRALPENEEHQKKPF
jgi:hypothetical protein